MTEKFDWCTDAETIEILKKLWLKYEESEQIWDLLAYIGAVESVPDEFIRTPYYDF